MQVGDGQDTFMGPIERAVAIDHDRDTSDGDLCCALQIRARSSGLAVNTP